MPRFKSVVIIAALTVHQTFADTGFGPSISTDTVVDLISPANAEASVYSDIPAAFPAIQFPGQFEIVGSIDWVTNVRVVLATSLAEEQATELVVSTFESSDWIVLPQIDTTGLGGILLPENLTPPTYTQLCHDENGTISVSYSARGLRNLVILSAVPAVLVSPQRRSTCEEQVIQRTNAVTGTRSQRGSQQMGTYLPDLTVPGQQPANLFMNSAFFPGSDGIMERKLSIEIDWALAELYEYFAGQLNDKGWELEVQAIGDASAFGSWTRSPEPGVELRGMLTVIGTGDSRFDFELKILLPEGYR